MKVKVYILIHYDNEKYFYISDQNDQEYPNLINHTSFSITLFRKIMIWAGVVVITFAIAVRIYPIFIFLLKERIKPLVEALYDKLLLFLWAAVAFAQAYRLDPFILKELEFTQY
ncbi:hypothetical protein ACJX0J_007154, partial [Zea mays]